MAYDPAELRLTDTTSESWALAWARFLSRDTSEPFRLSDDEWLGWLDATAHTNGDGVVHYRPHEAVATSILADPDRVISESLMSASATYRNPGDVAQSIRLSGNWIDTLIGISRRLVVRM